MSFKKTLSTNLLHCGYIAIWIPLSTMKKLQVNALGEWIIGIYLHEFTNNEREISITHEAAECGIEKISNSLLVNECR